MAVPPLEPDELEPDEPEDDDEPPPPLSGPFTLPAASSLVLPDGDGELVAVSVLPPQPSKSGIEAMARLAVRANGIMAKRSSIFMV
jgi:hypothetical protein